MLVKCNYNIVGASALAALPLLEDRELEGPARIFAVLRTVWTEIWDDVSGIGWRHSLSLGVFAPSALITTGTIVVFTLHIFLNFSLSP